MRLEFTDEEQAFREEVRTFLREKLSSDISDKVLNGYERGREEHLLWQRRLHERGWGGMGWPVEFGGSGWNSVQQYIFEEESALAGGPRLIPFGTKMVAPVIMAFGSVAQQQRFLPKISAGAEGGGQGATLITTSSTARRPGIRSVNMPIGYFVWCAPTAKPSSSPVSPFC